jgi:hypothetical protein
VRSGKDAGKGESKRQCCAGWQNKQNEGGGGGGEERRGRVHKQDSQVNEQDEVPTILSTEGLGA